MYDRGGEMRQQRKTMGDHPRIDPLNGTDQRREHLVPIRTARVVASVQGE